MALYLLTFTVRDEGRDIGPLAENMRQRVAVQVLPSAWLLSAPEGKARQICNDLLTSELLKGDDRLLVQEVGSDAGWINLYAQPSDVERFRKLARDFGAATTTTTQI